MPWVNIVSHYNDQAAEPGGAVTAFGGYATDGSTLEYSSPLGNETTIIWQSCSIDLIALQGVDRDHVGNYGQSFPGEGTILRANYYSTIEPGFALRALSTGRPSMFQRYRYRMAPLMSPCEVYSAQPEAGLVLSHSSWGGLAVIPANLDTSWNWVEVDFAGREGEVGPYQDVIGVGALIRQSDGYIPEEGWVMEWQVWVEEDEPPEPEKKLPWWMCVPLPPKPPCPVRPPLTGFVPFDQYDADFKYPLKSSRVRAALKSNPDCVACGPVVEVPVEPEVPVDPPPVDNEIVELIALVQCDVQGIYSFGVMEDPNFDPEFPGWLARNTTITFQAQDNSFTVYYSYSQYGEVFSVGAEGNLPSCCEEISGLKVSVHRDDVGGDGIPAGMEVHGTIRFNCA